MRANQGDCTRAEERSATRDALIAAAVSSLMARGVAGTSTRRVAEAAGVSQGALQYHFANKGILVQAALESTLVQSLEELLTAPVTGGPARDQASDFLDRLWRFHRLPIFGAVFEVLALAQRDPQASQLAAVTLAAVVARIETAAYDAFPELPAQLIPTRVRLVLATIRGAATIGAVLSTDEAPDWPAIRDDLVTLMVRPTLT